MSSKKSNRKKVLLLARSLDSQSAGIHVFAKNLILHLEKYGDHNSFKYTIVRVGKAINMPLSNIKQVFFENKNKIPGYDSIRLFFLVPRYAKKNNFDIVVELSHFGPVNLPQKIKRVTVMHDLTPILNSEFHTFKSSLLQKLFLPRFLHKADLIISNSLNTKQDILKTYPKISGKSAEIYLGVDPKYQVDENKDIHKLSEYSITQNYILYLGTIEPRKNLVVLIKAFEEFKEKNNSNLLLVLAGKAGWKNDDLFNVLEKSKYREDVKLIGYIENNDLASIYSNASVFVYPSIYEGFGLPIVEALCSGVQVICAKNSSLLEFGENLVTYFDTHDYKSLADKLKTVVIDKKTKHIDIPALKKKYSWKSYVSQFEKLLKEL